jgi:hypothetical protein
MPERLDADISLVSVVGGRPQTDEPPGYAMFAAPRRAARGRERDTLFLSLSLRARNPLPAERYTDLLNAAASVYFGAPGSVTAAARQAIAAVNARLLDSNLKEGAPVQGGLICAVLRGKELYAVQCGHGALVIAHAHTSERFPAHSSRALGLSDTLEAQYFHTTVAPGEYLALSANANWNDAGLIGLGGLATLSAAAERLKAATTGDFTALLGRLEPGGTLMPAPAPVTEAEPATAEPHRPAIALPSVGLPSLNEITARLRSVTQREEPEAEAMPLALRGYRPDLAEPTNAPEPVGMRPAIESEAVPAATNGHPLETVAPTPSFPEAEPVMRAPSARDAEAVSNASASSDSAFSDEGVEEDDEPQPIRRETPSIDLSSIAAGMQRGLRSFGRAIGVSLTELARAFRRLLARMLPEGMLQREGLFAIPPSVQIALALIIPAVIVTTALLIYVQRGQEEQFTEAVLEAKKQIATARTQTDQVAALPYWDSALQWVDRAERFRPGDVQLPPLRQEAQTELDALNWTQRLAYQPLLPNGVGAGSQLGQLVLVGRDVFALDSEQNKVWRLTATSPTTYALDTNFQCASGTFGDVTIGPLVDLIHIPGPIDAISAQQSVPNPNADAVVALDEKGTLLYCTIGGRPLVSRLPSPDVGFSQPVAMELFGSTLYVLDIGQNQIWQFAMQAGSFTATPNPYFTMAVYNLSDVVDFAIGGENVFLMRHDGRFLRCTRQELLNTIVCDDQAAFLDERPGRTSDVRLADLTAPRSLFSDQPQNPSVWVVNPENNGLYQVSYKLRYTRQYQPLLPLPNPINGMTLDSGQVFVSAGNNVFVANSP